MGYNNGIITTTGISIADVSAVLGAASSDVGTLCRHSNINIWSRHKPVSYPHPEDTSRTMSVNPWIGDDPTNAPYGISIPWQAPGSGTFPSQLFSTNIGYKRPSGGASSPYRLGDFRGYDHNCVVPYNVELPEGEYPRNQGMIRIMLNKYSVNSYQLSANNITFDELYAGKYFCVIAKSGNNIYYKTLNSDEPTTSLKDCPLWSGQNQLSVGTDVEIYACVSNKPMASWTNSLPDNVTLYGLKTDGVTVQSVARIGKELVNTYSGTATINGVRSQITAKSVSDSGGYWVVDFVIKHIGTRYSDGYLLKQIKVNATDNVTGNYLGSSTLSSGSPINSFSFAYNIGGTFQLRFAKFGTVSGYASVHYDIQCIFEPQGTIMSGGGSSGGGEIM